MNKVIFALKCNLDVIILVESEIDERKLARSEQVIYQYYHYYIITDKLYIKFNRFYILSQNNCA
jgi:hypothetical protein